MMTLSVLFFVYCFSYSLYIVIIMLLLVCFYADVRTYTCRTRLRYVEHRDCFLLLSHLRRGSTGLIFQRTLRVRARARVFCARARAFRTYVSTLVLLVHS